MKNAKWRIATIDNSRCVEDFNVVKTDPSRNHFVRMNIRMCNNCRKDISNRPRTHRQCLQCFRRKKIPKRENINKEEVSLSFNIWWKMYEVSENIWIQFKRIKRRDCASCGKSISSRPRNHKLCSQCFVRRPDDFRKPFELEVRKLSQRMCSSCSADISGRPKNHKVCPSCYSKKVWKSKSSLHRRTCKHCNCNISNRPQNHKFCLRCWKRNVSRPLWNLIA